MTCLPACRRYYSVSDVVAELNAARKAGMATALSVRPGNAKEGENGHAVITDFSQLKP